MNAGEKSLSLFLELSNLSVCWGIDASMGYCKKQSQIMKETAGLTGRGDDDTELGGLACGL